MTIPEKRDNADETNSEGKAKAKTENSAVLKNSKTTSAATIPHQTRSSPEKGAAPKCTTTGGVEREIGGANMKDTLDADFPAASSGVGVGVGSSGMFSQEREPEARTETVVGLLVDLDPRHPAFLSVMAVLCIILLSVSWARKTFHKRRAARSYAAFSDSDGSLEETRSNLIGSAKHTPRGRRSDAGSGNSKSPRSAGKVMILTPEQASLCDVFYDSQRGVFPTRVADVKATLECGLTLAELQRQFKNIKQARAAARAKSPSSSGRSKGALSRAPTMGLPASARKKTTGAVAGGTGELTTPPSKKSSAKNSRRRPLVASPKVSATPVSPKKTPVMRGPAAIKPARSPKSGDARAKRPAVTRLNSTPSKQAKRKPTILESPIVTRDQDRSPPPALPGSPKVTPKKRAAGGGRKVSPSLKTAGFEKSPPSLLEIARRKAQLKIHALADARVESLKRNSSKISGATRSKRAKP